MTLGTNQLAGGLVLGALVFAVHALRPPAVMSRAGPAAFDRPVDVNRATVEELASLDGIGPKLGARIVAARPFRSVDDLAKVRGVGRRRLARLRPRLLLDERTGDRVR